MRTADQDKAYFDALAAKWADIETMDDAVVRKTVSVLATQVMQWRGRAMYWRAKAEVTERMVRLLMGDGERLKVPEE